MENSRHRQGDLHPTTGKVFYGYQKSCAGGERWMTIDKYAAKMVAVWKYRKTIAAKIVIAKRRNTDTERAKRGAYARVWNKSDVRREKAARAARERRASNPAAAVADRLRARVREAFRWGGWGKRSTTGDLLGCSWGELLSHLESQFLPGMTWDNRCDWEIDHRLPLSSAKSEDDMVNLSHYTNLQPLWRTDNRRKGNRNG